MCCHFHKNQSQAIMEKAPRFELMPGGLDPWVLALVERSLQKEQDVRWQTAQQMGAEVARCLELLPRFWSGERFVGFASSLRECMGKMPHFAAELLAKEMHRAVADHDADVCRWGAVMSATPPPWGEAQRPEHSHRRAFEMSNARQAAAFGLLKHVRDCASHKVAGCDDEQIGAACPLPPAAALCCVNPPQAPDVPRMFDFKKCGATLLSQSRRARRNDSALGALSATAAPVVS